jgi:hypothetical protein
MRKIDSNISDSFSDSLRESHGRESERIFLELKAEILSR